MKFWFVHWIAYGKKTNLSYKKRLRSRYHDATSFCFKPIPYVQMLTASYKPTEKIYDLSSFDDWLIAHFNRQLTTRYNIFETDFWRC